MATYQDSIMAKMAEAKAKVEEYQAIYDALNVELQNEMQLQGQTKFSGVYGKVTICERTNYEFSADIKAAEIRLKAEKDIEKNNGIAMIKSITKYLRIIWN